MKRHEKPKQLCVGKVRLGQKAFAAALGPPLNTALGTMSEAEGSDKYFCSAFVSLVWLVWPIVAFMFMSFVDNSSKSLEPYAAIVFALPVVASAAALAISKPWQHKFLFRWPLAICGLLLLLSLPVWGVLGAILWFKLTW